MPNRIETPFAERPNSVEKPFRVDIVIDTTCPWCYLGQRRFARAMAERSTLRPEIRWRPFRIDRAIPTEGRDRGTDLAARFGGIERAKRRLAALEKTGAREGVTFRFDLIGLTPNTLDSHRLIAFAARSGAAEATVDRLFSAYFSDGLDIGDRSTLAGIGGELGLGRKRVQRFLQCEEDRPFLLAEDEKVRSLGVKGVPCYILEGRYAISGAQSPEVFLRVIDLARQDMFAQAAE